jgi:hypothetical protein
MTNGANYKRGKLHHSPWHSDIRTPNQLNRFTYWHTARPCAECFNDDEDTQPNTDFDPDMLTDEG